MSGSADDFFAEHPESRAVFEAVRAAIEETGPAEMAVSKSQIAFRRRHGFAQVWMPEVYLGRGAPLVLTLGLRRRVDSPRFKSIVEPAPGRFTHHIELFAPDEVDAEVKAWIAEAWGLAE